MFKYAKVFFNFVRSVISSRRLILRLTINDFKTRYLGSYIGLIWAFIQPTVTVLIFWFVFQAGFKLRPVSDVPFIIWLLGGMVPWFFFSEAWISGTNSIIEYSYLVKKVVFKVNLLPIIKICAAFPIHIFFMTLVLICMQYYDMPITIYMLQIFYYLAGMLLLLLGLSWLTSALVVFIKDISQLVNIITQLGFWITPIFWSLEMMPEKYHTILKINPMFYITNGYRNSIQSKEWFWQQPMDMLCFWLVVGCFFIVGSLVFYKLRPHFADVL